jgi:hypothetical protein
MPIFFLAIPPIAFAVAYVLARPLGRRVTVAIGLAFILIGVVAIGVLEWRYTPKNTTPVTMAIALDKPGVIRTPAFRAAITGPYEVWLRFNHGDDVADFDCWIGSDGMAPNCPKADPALNLGWTVTENNLALARGRTDWSGWHAAQARLDPADAAAARARYQHWQGKAASDPSNRDPLYFLAGHFPGTENNTYAVELKVLTPAGRLATLRPTLVVGLAASATKGLGVLVTVFALLWVLAGAALCLTAIPRNGSISA